MWNVFKRLWVFLRRKRGHGRNATPVVVCLSAADHPSTPPTIAPADNATLAAFLMHQRAVEYQGRGTLHLNMLLLLADVAQVVAVAPFDESSIAHDSGYETSSSGPPPLSSLSASTSDFSAAESESMGPPPLETPTASSASLPSDA